MRWARAERRRIHAREKTADARTCSTSRSRHWGPARLNRLARRAAGHASSPNKYQSANAPAMAVRHATGAPTLAEVR